MAIFESQNPSVRFMNQEIREQVIPHQSIETIKGVRRMRTYKDRLAALKTRREPCGPAPGAPSSPGSANASGSFATPWAGPSDLEPTTQNSAEEEMCTYVQELLMALGLTVPSRIYEVEALVDLWRPPRAYAYRPPSVDNQVSQEKKKPKEKDNIVESIDCGAMKEARLLRKL